MIQRIQTVYLLLAVIAAFVALTQPVALLVPDTIGENIAMYNNIPLYVVLLLACTVEVFSILLYKNRLRQLHWTATALILIVLWYATYGIVVGYKCQELECHWDFKWAMLLPFVSFVLVYMARRAIKADERLVRSADRLRG